MSDMYLVEGEPQPPPTQENIGGYPVAAPDYLQTMQIPIVRGRAFTEHDQAGGHPVVIVNEALARKHWPGQEPIGKRIRFYGEPDRTPWKEIVGVVKDVTHELNLPVTPEYYLPFAQEPWSGMTLVARTKVAPTSRSEERRVGKSGASGGRRTSQT